jgi:hypothetical protein
MVESKPHFRVVIADFGTARMATETTLLQVFASMPQYIVPKCLQNPVRITGSRNIWSLTVAPARGPRRRARLLCQGELDQNMDYTSKEASGLPE